MAVDPEDRDTCGNEVFAANRFREKPVHPYSFHDHSARIMNDLNVNSDRMHNLNVQLQ